MGVNIDTEQEKGYIIAESKRLKGIDFVFPGKTVTGTENILMASVLAEGETILKNCAVEPEVTDLAEYLVSMGAEIDGIGTDMLVIKGKSSLHGASHSVIPDRIEAGTYLIAACFKGNNIKIKGGNPGHIKSVLDILGNIGCRITSDNGIMSVSKGELKNGIHVETEPFPGFPTDLQAQLTTLMTQIEGISSIRENIFNNRFKHAIELNKLGADIEISENKSIIKGRTHLTGAYVRATDLRASASLVLAGLLAEGKTVIDNSYQLFRGYEDMHIKLNKIGADIKVIEV
jgi:UDP-N-acetylglucosamine 1-carboxyvinyltransferase